MFLQISKWRFPSLRITLRNKNYMDMSLHSPREEFNVSEPGFKGRSKLAGSTLASYYCSYAYRPDAIPEQSNQTQELNRTGLDRSASLRLPWGNTREVMPPTFMSRNPPKKLRRLEKKEDLAEKYGLHVESNHECFRHAPLALQARLVSIISVTGALWAYIVSPFAFFMLVLITLFGERERNWLDYSLDQALPYLIFLGGGWLLILMAKLALRLFPTWLLRNGRGPEWEFNRRTGMIKVWQYPKKFPFLPRKPPVVVEKPFYEFDAWCCARVDRFGTLFDLVLSHRYSKLDVTVGDILGAHGSPTMCYAYWDFIQNYMDITRPLPELPLLEQYRHLDPTTAKHDQATGRPSRYWRDMDDKTFKQKVDDMFTDVSIIDTTRRPDLMAAKLSYAS
ncbi:hypothetical protein [Marinobacter nauticus]|uniref:hypothetical protein n=1 Tax=Marinobacter nauticus TaxID=2743 RepID=UPI000F23E104|nr:hypothetical protein [Marinobacter nauticus]RKR78583.1 hypothetical protein C7436_2302 [Marinobacter nauticus]